MNIMKKKVVHTILFLFIGIFIFSSLKIMPIASELENNDLEIKTGRIEQENSQDYTNQNDENSQLFLPSTTQKLDEYESNQEKEQQQTLKSFFIQPQVQVKQTDTFSLFSNHKVLTNKDNASISNAFMYASNLKWAFLFFIFIIIGLATFFSIKYLKEDGIDNG